MAVAVSRNGLRFATVDPYGFALVWPTGDKDSIPALVPSPSVSNAAFSVALSPSGSPRRLAQRKLCFEICMHVHHAFRDGSDGLPRRWVLM